MAYVELVIQGQPGWTLGFIQGYAKGRGEKDWILDAETEGFDCESLKERLLELVKASYETIHLLVPDRLVSVVEQAVRETNAFDRKTEVVHRQAIRGVRFSFNVTAYSKEHGDRIRGHFQHQPGTVEVNAEANVKVDPEAKGVEMYAPAHHYEMNAEGTVRGDLFGVLNLYRTLREEELVQLSELEIEDAD